MRGSAAFRVPVLLAAALTPFAHGQAQGLPNTLTVTSATPPPYQANVTLQTSGTVTVSGPGTTTYNAGSQILLQPGFTAVATPGSSTPSFIAAIAPPPFYPNSGSGVSQTFSVTASDPGGYANITNIQIIYNWQPSGVDGCLLNYDVVNDALEIGDLTGSLSTFGSISLRSPAGNLGDLVSSNCQILGAGSSIVASGNNITLALNTNFRQNIGTGNPLTGGTPGFIGQQNIYLAVTSNDGTGTGSFQNVGTWTALPVPEPGTFSVINAPGAFNADGTLTVEFNDLNGYNYQPYAELTFGASLTDPNACRIRYDRGTGAANHLISVYAGAFNSYGHIQTAPVGVHGVVQNLGCFVDYGASYVVQDSGDGAIVNLAVTFKTTGTINSYAQSWDRQNAVSTLSQTTIYVPPNDFSLSQVSALSVVQSAPAQPATLTITTTGTFASNVALTCTGPTAVAFTCPATVATTAGGSFPVSLSVSATTAIAPGTVTLRSRRAEAA